MPTPSPPVAFDECWSSNSKAIYAYIYSLVFNGPDADDIFQETALVVLQKFDEFEQGTNFTAWACRVAYHKAMKSMETRRARKFLDPRLLETLGQESHHAADNLDQRLAALSVCLEKLSQKDREMVVARYVGGNSIDQLAKDSHRSESLIYKRLTGIHDSLLRCIRRRLAEGGGQ